MRNHLPRRLRNPLPLRRAILLGIALIIAVYRFRNTPPRTTPRIDVPSEQSQPHTDGSRVDAPEATCGDWQGCFTGVVSHVVDGDTLDVRSSSGTSQRIRLVLVDAPERDTAQGPAATQHLIALCPVNSSVAVLPDASQPRDDYGRTLAVIYCGGQNANEDMIRSGRAKLYRRFCSKSAFGKQDWARELGCR